jgi:endonuclease/exonuclease/phosphatase family metal-dependent hydrolase
VHGVLDEIAADVVALQEVESRPGRGGGFNQFAAFGGRDGMHAVAGPAIHEEDGCYGNLLLSRFPVREHRLLDLRVGRHEPRQAVEVVLDAPAGPLLVLATHLGLWGWQARALGVLGLATGRQRSPASYPARWPMLPLDRVLGRPGRLVRELRRHESALARIASDHFPVVAELDASG